MLKSIFLFAFAISAIQCNVSPETPFELFTRLCVTMLPEHNNTSRQPTPFPVTIVRTPQGPYRVGQQVLVTLRGDPGFNFTGFLIQARVPGNKN